MSPEHLYSVLQRESRSCDVSPCAERSRQGWKRAPGFLPALCSSLQVLSFRSTGVSQVLDSKKFLLSLFQQSLFHLHPVALQEGFCDSQRELSLPWGGEAMCCLPPGPEWQSRGPFNFRFEPHSYHCTPDKLTLVILYKRGASMCPLSPLPSSLNSSTLCLASTGLWCLFLGLTDSIFSAPEGQAGGLG